MAYQPLTNDGDGDTARAEYHPDADLFELNLTWLLQARELAQRDRGRAAVLFGLDGRLAEVLAGASIQALRALARSGVMVFRPRFHVGFWQQRCEADPRASAGLALQSVMIAAEESAE